MNLFQFIASLFKKEMSEKSFANTHQLSSQGVSADIYHWSGQEISSFINQLKQVISWTEKLCKDFDFENGFYGTVLRQTNPIIDGVKLYSFDGDYATWNLDDYDSILYQRLLEMAINSRDNVYDVDLSNLDNLGRIICFQTGCTTHDGAAIVESKCFVDESDVPPIDTWFYLKSDYYQSGYLSKLTLFCWIPKQFEQLMHDAIRVEIFDSYSWFDTNDVKVYDFIKIKK